MSDPGDNRVGSAARDSTSVLAEMALTPLPPGMIRPTGWLRDQLRFQAAGLSGHLDEFWPSIMESAWIGGAADGWERGPYWLDGIVPLALLLDDAPLLHKARRWIDYILQHQRADGWMGPVLKNPDGTDRYDTWPLYPLLKAFTQWHDATADPRIVPTMQRLLRHVLELIRREPIYDWGHYRTADLVLSIDWLQQKTGEPWLGELAQLVESQGFDWGALFRDFPHRAKTTGLQANIGFSRSTHGVNIAMGLKQPAVRFRRSGQPADRDAVFHMIEQLDRFHGQASGVFSCDEHLAGPMPSQGIELCTVVEYLFSLEVALAITGAAILADRIEWIAFNALPAAFKPDMWAHQYDQQANQVVCRVSHERIYTDNGCDANLFGLEPHYGCCTANFSQGWPKFATHLWMRAGEDAIAAISYAPCEVRVTINQVDVTIRVETEYPFSEQVLIAVKTCSAVRFTLHLRIPGWANGAEVRRGRSHWIATTGEFHPVTHDWPAGRTDVRLRLPMPVRAARRFNNAVSFNAGPLVLSLNIPAQWRKLRGTLPYADWELLPTAPWNYALQLDSDVADFQPPVERCAVQEQPFCSEHPPLRVRVQGRQIEQWAIDRNAAAAPPVSPVFSEAPLQPLELIPYGAAKLRVTELPVLGRLS